MWHHGEARVNTTKTIQTALLGAVTFWVPDLAIHAIAGRNFGRAGMAAATLLMVGATVSVFLRFDKSGRATLVGWSRAVAMLLAIWLLGPWLIMLGFTFGGGGFANPVPGWGLMVLFVPGVVFILATYDGSLAALLLITALLPVIMRFTSPDRRIHQRTA
jgi:hypothetical protein